MCLCTASPTPKDPDLAVFPAFAGSHVQDSTLERAGKFA